MRTKLDKARLALQVAKVREKVLQGQIEVLNAIFQMFSETIIITSRAVEAYWCGSPTAVEVTHVAERRSAPTKWVETKGNEVAQWMRVTRVEKANTVLSMRMKKLVTENNRLTVRCDELAHENQCDLRLEKKTDLTLADFYITGTGEVEKYLKTPLTIIQKLY